MNASLEKSKKLPLARVLDIPPEADSVTVLNRLHDSVRTFAAYSVQAALAAGWLLTIEKANHAGTFEKWLDANTRISRPTAYRYMACFARSIGTRNDVKVLTATAKEREEMIETCAAEMDSRSVSEMYVELGVVKKTPSNLGGRREGAGRPRKMTEDELRAQAAALATDPKVAEAEWQDLAAKAVAFALNRDGFALMDPPSLAAAEGVLRTLLERIARVRKAAAR